MTRFARAKGSKSSNERVPENATPWQTMKEQMEQRNREISERKVRKEMEEKRAKNYKSFLEERENDVKHEWAEFEDTSGKQKGTVKTNKKKKRKIREESHDINEDSKLDGIIGEIEKVLEKEGGENKSKIKKRKKLNLLQNIENGVSNLGNRAKNNSSMEKRIEENESHIKIHNKTDLDEDAPDEITAKIPQDALPVKKKIKTKVPKKTSPKIPSTNESGSEKVVLEDGQVQKDIEKESKQKSLKTNKLKKNPKKNNKVDPPKPKKSLDEMTEDEIKRVNKQKAKKIRQLESKKMHKAMEKEKAAMEQQTEDPSMKKRKLPKPRDNEEHKKRKPNSQVHTMTINGIDIEIDYYDGFPIKKEDAERLRKLRKEMISKGIPKSEVQISLKLERRRAEKALAREKKKVCFNCRKSGHNLSECPNLNENSQQEIAGTGICFKCGSTEHTHFECKVVRTDNFRYATCFICREQGHISRQCPDNQNGLYPKGGACRVCGDVTHLKKDCPKYQADQESQILKLDALDDDNLEGIPGENVNGARGSSNKPNKIVKF